MKHELDDSRTKDREGLSEVEPVGGPDREGKWKTLEAGKPTTRPTPFRCEKDVGWMCEGGGGFPSLKPSETPI